MTDSAFVPQARAYVRGTGGYYPLRPDEHESLLEAWTNGRAFFAGHTVDGDEVTLKLAEIESVLLCSTESQEAAIARTNAEAKASQPL
jgi:hypothetical protein